MHAGVLTHESGKMGEVVVYFKTLPLNTIGTEENHDNLSIWPGFLRILCRWWRLI